MKSLDQIRSGCGDGICDRDARDGQELGGLLDQNKDACFSDDPTNARASTANADFFVGAAPVYPGGTMFSTRPTARLPDRRARSVLSSPSVAWLPACPVTTLMRTMSFTVVWHFRINGQRRLRHYGHRSDYVEHLSPDHRRLDAIPAFVPSHGSATVINLTYRIQPHAGSAPITAPQVTAADGHDH